MAALVPVALGELLGMPATLMFLHLGAPDLPVVQAEGTIRVANEKQVVLELHSTLPGLLDERCRFGVYAEGRRGLVSFQSTLAEPYKPGGRTLHLVTPTRVDTVQRRRFPRVKLNAPVTYHNPEGRWVGKAINLSASGLLLISETPVTAGEEYHLELDIPGAEALQGMSTRVVRCLPTSEGQYQVALRFIDLTVAREMALIKLVWREQIRQQRYRGLRG